MRNDSAQGASSEGDRTFDFKYKFDISDRKGKTGQTFKQQQGFQFEDFKDFKQDRSQKSFITSQRKVLPSQLVKRSQQSFVITQNQTQLSIKRKGGSFITENKKNTISQQSSDGNFFPKKEPSQGMQKKFYQTVTNDLNALRSPQFAKQQKQRAKYTSKISLEQPIHQHNLNFSNRSQKQIGQISQQNVSPRNQSRQKQLSYNVSSSRQQTANFSSRITPQAQYKDLLATIQYYQNDNQKLDYQMMKMQQQINRYQKLIEQNPAIENQLIKLTDETNTLNTMISNQRSLQRTLIQNHKNLQEEYDQLLLSIQSLKFQRPSVMKDQTKAIIDQINSLKAQLQSIKRDQGSLNLSNTLHNPNNPPSLQDRISFLPDMNKKNFNPQDTIMKQIISEIVQNSKSQPNYIYNTKMMAIKDQWKIFQNSQICINCCTRDYPMLQFRIGNKSIKPLNDFMLKQGASLIADKQILQSKNYYIHSYKMNKISQPFLKMQLAYKVSNTSIKQDTAPPKNYVFFMPTLPIKHGQFIPITKKQYDKQDQQHMNVLQQIVSFQKPIDTAIIKQDISEFLLFYPNLLYQRNSKGEGCCKGIFRLWNSAQGSLVKIKQRGATVSIYIRNYIPFLLQSLQFLLTTLV